MKRRERSRCSTLEMIKRVKMPNHYETMILKAVSERPGRTYTSLLKIVGEPGIKDGLIRDRYLANLHSFTFALTELVDRGILREYVPWYERLAAKIMGKDKEERYKLRK